MAALTKDINVKFEYDDENSIPVAASTKIYKGAMVGDNGSGYARPLVAGDPFLGFALFQVDNSSGAAGAKRVEMKIKDRCVVAVTGASGVGDVGDAVYASDDNTFTKTSTSNTYIGKIIRWEAGTRCVVRFDALPAAQDLT
jgi:hypothetical protein